MKPSEIGTPLTDLWLATAPDMDEFPTAYHPSQYTLQARLYEKFMIGSLSEGSTSSYLFGLFDTEYQCIRGVAISNDQNKNGVFVARSESIDT